MKEMSEDNQQSLGLGEHVDRALNDHVAKHAGEVATEKQARDTGKAERMEIGQGLHDLLEKAAKAEGGGHDNGNWNKKDGISARTIQERADGTTIRAGLDTGGDYTDQAVRISTRGQRYFDEGPAVNAYDGQPFTLPDGNDHEAENYGLLRGLNVKVGIYSHDDETNVRNSSRVFVARIIDPECLLVPEATAEDGQQLYSLIGAEDSRFVPIMHIVDRIASQR